MSQLSEENRLKVLLSMATCNSARVEFMVDPGSSSFRVHPLPITVYLHLTIFFRISTQTSRNVGGGYLCCLIFICNSVDIALPFFSAFPISTNLKDVKSDLFRWAELTAGSWDDFWNETLQLICLQKIVRFDKKRTVEKLLTELSEFCLFSITKLEFLF